MMNVQGWGIRTAESAVAPPGGCTQSNMIMITSNIYKPILTREEYIQSFVTEARDNVFGGSMRSLFSFFVRNEKLSKEEIREILKEMGDE